MASTKSKTSTATATTTTSLTATQVAELLATATTPAQKGTATRRLKAYVAERTAAGCDATRVETQVRRLATKFTPARSSRTKNSPRS